MALYTLESSRTIARIANKIMVADTSYLIALSDNTDHHHSIILDFHQEALLAKASFLINVIVRQEFIQFVRKAQMIDAILNLAKTDADFEARCKRLARLKNPKTALTSLNLKPHYNEIYKDLIKQGDHKRLIDALSGNIWDEVAKIEKSTEMNYSSGLGQMDWKDLGVLMQQSGLSSTDCMIANFALFVAADALVTKDVDYAPLADLLDIYMPSGVANGCASYNATLD